MAAIGAARGGAYPEAALGEVESVADGAAHAIVWDPLEQRCVDPALKDEVFHQAPHRIFGEHRGNGGAQAEAPAQTARHVVFAASLPPREVARAVDAAF